MTHFLRAFVLLLIAGSTFGQSREDYAKSITADGIKKHLMILASDEYEGRETGKPGQKKAAKYITNYFQEIGLEGPVEDSKNPYLQSVPLIESKWGAFYVKSAAGKQYTWLEDFYQMGNFNIEEQELAVVFAGYGIESDQYSDYKDLDVKGKAVVVLTGKPSDKIAEMVGDLPVVADYASSYTKLKTAITKGATLVILMQEKDKNIKTVTSTYAPYIKKPTLGLEAEEIKSAGTIVAGPSMTKEILGMDDKSFAKSLAKYKKGKSARKYFGESRITIKAEQTKGALPSENVLGYLEGSDLKDEVLIITAHYDHIGINDDGQINNGADDDGSGTSTLLEIARAFAKAKADGNGPRRSILFMTVTGEEKGLLGSEYYSDNPIFPIEQSVTNLNIDMIGRIDDEHKDDPNYVYIIGSDMLSSDLHELSIGVQAKYANNVKLDYRYNDKNDPNRFYYRSDHYNFAKHDIPVIFYFTGVHEDYHKPTDTPDKILYDKTSNIGRLIFHTAWEIAHRDKRVVVDKPSK